jgi:hypothetical protein
MRILKNESCSYCGMDLREYLKTIHKKGCPRDCELKKKGKIRIALIPPPDRILGIIVSRDPTVDWLYTYLKDETDKNTCRKMLFASAIPLDLLSKVLIFMRNKRVNEDKKKSLFNVIFQKTYWTHLHKCFTDASGKGSVKFKKRNAELCANTWLEKELKCAIEENKIKFIIALGKDVQNRVEEIRKNNKWKDKDAEIINLPHPSGQNNAIWYRSQKGRYNQQRKKVEKQIIKLLKLCKTC